MAKVLIVDDDPSTALITRTVLEVHGHSVVSVTDPLRAVSTAVELQPDCVVLDIVMPEVSGFALFGQLRETCETNDIPVLFLSALSTAADRVQGLRLGANDYLTKPFEPEELVLRVERMTAARIASPTTLRRRTDGLYLGRYRIEKELGRGAMGSVFRAWDPKLERAVALKRVQLEGPHSRPLPALEQLLREAIATAQLNHPHIVAIYDFDDTPPSAFIAMELVEGMTLAELLVREGPLAPERVVPLALALARALRAAHERGLFHHDIKPENVLLGFDGAIKVTDFGLARFATAVAAASSSVFGTAGYLPPEAIMGAGQTASGDLFALGALLYRCLAGLLPFGGSTLGKVLASTLQDEPPALYLGDGWRDLEALVLQLLAKAPNQRPPTAAAVEERLLPIAPAGATAWAAPLRADPLPHDPGAHPSRFLTAEELAPLRQ